MHKYLILVIFTLVNSINLLAQEKRVLKVCLNDSIVFPTECVLVLEYEGFSDTITRKVTNKSKVTSWFVYSLDSIAIIEEWPMCYFYSLIVKNNSGVWKNPLYKCINSNYKRFPGQLQAELYEPDPDIAYKLVSLYNIEVSKDDQVLELIDTRVTPKLDKPVITPIKDESPKKKTFRFFKKKTEARA